MQEICNCSTGLIYIVGGLSDSGSELCSAEMFDPIAKRWMTLESMKTKRVYVGIAALNDCVYAVGGWNETQNALRTVEKYSLQEVGVVSLLFIISCSQKNRKIKLSFILFGMCAVRKYNRLLLKLIKIAFWLYPHSWSLVVE